MTLELWLAFVVASAVLVAVPGPTVMLTVSYALGRGTRSALATVPGVTLGDFTAMSLSLAGAALAASAELFTILKLAGAGYLIWLGIGLWRDARRATAPAGTVHGTVGDLWPMFRQSFMVTALNPKSIMFFIAFVPQFIDPAAPLLPQVALLEATFLSLAALNITLWAILAGEMRRRAARPVILGALHRADGAVLIGAGLLTAAMRRPV